MPTPTQKPNNSVQLWNLDGAPYFSHVAWPKSPFKCPIRSTSSDLFLLQSQLQPLKSPCQDPIHWVCGHSSKVVFIIIFASLYLRRHCHLSCSGLFHFREQQLWQCIEHWNILKKTKWITVNPSPEFHRAWFLHVSPNWCGIFNEDQLPHGLHCEFGFKRPAGQRKKALWLHVMRSNVRCVQCQVH